MPNQTVCLPQIGDWDALKDLGVQRLQDVSDIQCEAILPDGWYIQQGSIDGSRVENLLVDATGIPIAQIIMHLTLNEQDASISII
jgi:hypothetical protein